MKCKSWSNKINNFVVRRLKSIKSNGQQQPLQQPTQTVQQPTTQQPQEQNSLTCSTMPAMPKEKAAAAVSLSESNFSELKLKELATSTAVVAGMANTSATAIGTPTTTNRPQAQQQNNISSNNTMNRNGSKYLNGYTLATSSQNGILSDSSQRGSSNLKTQPTTTVLTNGEVAATSNTIANNLATPQAAAAPVTPPKKSPKDFIFGKYIGEGSFSMVYLAVDVNTKREYAIKVCEKRHILRERKQENIRREREVMHLMTNVPGFVNLSCTFQDNRSLYFVMTLAKNGDLLPYINKVGSFDVDCTRHYAAELVLACEEMHSRNVVHRDLKPENILLDEDMHTLIADFGSVKWLSPKDIQESEEAYAAKAALLAKNKLGCHADPIEGQRNQRSDCQENLNEEEEKNEDEDENDTGSDEVDSPSRQSRYQRNRRGSFCGTAQYVSPEMLQNEPITPSADLWALGCIIYQMISGLPPFRGSNEYAIFKEILANNLDFPQGFDKDAEDLVRQLLKLNPQERLGSKDVGGSYDSIRSHAFFAGIDFDTVRQVTPPPIYPYLPGVTKDEDFRSNYRDFEPGLDDKQITRLIGMALGTTLGFQQDDVEIEKKTATKNNYHLTENEKMKRLAQQRTDKWHCFTDNEVILKKGYVNKRKGLFARKRMLLLTTGPRLIYIDPVHMVKKGEIPWSPELRVEPKNFKIFFVHTPNRTYYLEDPEGYSLEWVDAIEKMRALTYNDPATNLSSSNSTSTPSTSNAATTNSPTASVKPQNPALATNHSTGSESTAASVSVKPITKATNAIPPATSSSCAMNIIKMASN